MIRLKRILAVILAALMICSGLSACGEPTSETIAPAGTAEVSGSAEMPETAETPESSGTEETTEAKPGFFLTAEYDRLYFAPLDGSAPRLLVDNSTVLFEHWGDWLYASFEDGSVMRLTSDGKKEVLLPAGGHEYRKLIPFDGGFIGAYYSFIDGSGFDLYRDGSQTPESLFSDSPVIKSCAAGRYIYCHRYDVENDNLLVALDPDTLETVWSISVDSTMEMLRDGSGILCFMPFSGQLFRIDEDAQTLVPVYIRLAKTDTELVMSCDGTFLVKGNYSDEYRSYLTDENTRRLLEDETLPSYYSVLDVCEGKALLHYVTGLESAAGDHFSYAQDNYRVLDLKSGAITEFPVLGEYSALFASGDFPVMDSSTARKPVTSEIYEFFCESTGAGGTVPLCSTTHNAWLNIADGIADIALLAAPTQEEQDYLKERGVSVEMKLYGGDGLVFIGNRACGVDDLSLDQVRAIYRGEITNWAQLGGADHAIRVLYRDDQSGSQRLFERMVWKNEDVPDFKGLGFEILDDMSSIVSECLRDPYAIGYSIMTYLNDVFSKEELLAFSLEGYAATPENVASKNYPLGTQGYVVIRSDEPADSPARRLFDWFGSPLSDVILNHNSVTPLHDE